MIYEVYVDGNLLYYPNDETYVIINSKLDLALNEAGSFEFDVPTYNLRYDDFKLRKSMIQVLQDGEEIFYGEVREVKVNADFTKHVYAVGELAFLFDSIQPQGRYLTSPLNAMTQIIAKHNSQVEERKKFTLSQVNVTDNDDQIYFYTNGEDTLTIIREKILDVLDGYIKITKDANKRYISIVPLNSFGVCTQEIQFGENLLDYSCNMSASDIATCLVPRGAKLDEDKRTKNAVDGLDEYVTIVGTSKDTYHIDVNNDYVQLDTAIANFGYVRVMKTWDDVTKPDNLKKKAINWLKSAQYEAMTLELRAIDMSQFDVNIDTFRLGESVHIWAPPYGMDTNIRVRKKTIYLQDLEKNEVILGNTERQSYTKQQSKAVEQLKTEIPETSPILKQAQDSALSMLTDPDSGYVSYIFDENGNRTEIWIADSMIQSKITKKWVFNSAGLGYVFKEKGEWKTNVAITMDGAIVANMITSGVLKLGGNGSSTVLKIYNATKEIGSWSSDGIKINAGSINLGAYTTADKKTDYYFKVDNNGNLVCRKADIEGKITATSGKICNFNINTREIVSGLERDSLSNGNDKGTAEIYFYPGSGVGGFATRQGNNLSTITPFGISTSGELTVGKDIETKANVKAHGYYASSGGNWVEGKSTKTFVVNAYVDGEQKMVGLTFEEGILVGKSNV